MDGERRRSERARERKREKEKKKTKLTPRRMQLRVHHHWTCVSGHSVDEQQMDDATRHTYTSVSRDENNKEEENRSSSSPIISNGNENKKTKERKASMVI